MTRQANPRRSKKKEHTVQMESPESERTREREESIMRTKLKCCQH